MDAISRLQVVCAVAMTLGSATAWADPPQEPLTYAMRPLTLPAGILRLDGSFNAVTDRIIQTSSSGGVSIASPVTSTTSVLNLGLAVGITPDLEVSAHEPIQIGPSLASDDPYLRGRFRLFRGAVEGAAEVTVTFPADQDGVGVAAGLPILVRVYNVGRFDFIPRAGVDFIHPVAVQDARPPKNAAQAELQVYYDHQLSEGFTFGLHTAVVVSQFNSTDVAVPVGVRARLSLPRSDGSALGDIMLGFDFNKLFNGAGNGLDVNAYTIAMTGRLFLPL